MFEELVKAATAAGGAAVGEWARVENAACAHRLSAMVAVLDARHAAAGSVEREQWYLDNWSAVCAQIGAEQQITSGAASHQLLIATALRDRLPRVAEMFARGLVSYPVVSAIVWRTASITDADAVAAVDELLATALLEWEPMSRPKLVAAIDHWVHRVDPHAVRRARDRARSRTVAVTVDDGSGLCAVSGTLFAHDATAFDARLDALAATVCKGDPRTVEQRRADAVGAMAAGADRMRCLCATGDCPAAEQATTGAPVVVYVITHEDTLTDASIGAAAQNAALDGPEHDGFGLPGVARLRAEAAVTRPGMVMGGPVLAGPLLRRAAASAAIRRVFHPGAAPPETRYRPSRRLSDFVRCRDLTCRFPGCDVPASGCDVDHTIAYPVGPTQASNLKCLCRRHHLLKTFWGGVGGWRDRQSPDGAVEWISPAGRRYTTRPGSRLLFPSLCEPTAPAAYRPGAEQTPSHPEGLTMPRRQRTRAEDRTRRTHDERRGNERETARGAA